MVAIANNFVVGVTPVAGDLFVPVTTNVVVYFGRSMDATTINVNTVILTNQTLGGSQVRGSLTYLAASRTATFRPSALLRVGESYKVLIKGGTTGVKDITGLTMSFDYEIDFRCMDTPEFSDAVITLPANMSTIASDTVDFAWAAMKRDDEDGIEQDIDSYELQIAENSIFDILVWPLSPEPTHVFGTTVTPDYEFADGQYYARMRGVIQGEVGPWSQTITFVVDTSEVPGDGGGLPDDEPEEFQVSLQPTRFYPAQNSAFTPSNIMIEFSNDLLLQTSDPVDPEDEALIQQTIYILKGRWI